MYAYETNTVLQAKGASRGADSALIALYRRKCLLVGIWGTLPLLSPLFKLVGLGAVFTSFGLTLKDPGWVAVKRPV